MRERERLKEITNQWKRYAFQGKYVSGITVYSKDALWVLGVVSRCKELRRKVKENV